MHGVINLFLNKINSFYLRQKVVFFCLFSVLSIYFSQKVEAKCLNLYEPVRGELLFLIIEF